jgi:hypothetical protein
MGTLGSIQQNCPFHEWIEPTPSRQGAESIRLA